MKQVFKLSAVLLFAAIYSSCKPSDDDLPCGGKAVERFYDASGADSVMVPFLHQDTFVYLRTMINTAVKDTLVLVKTFEKSDYVLLWTAPELRCPEVQWGGQYHFKYVDVALKDSLDCMVEFTDDRWVSAVNLIIMDVIPRSYTLQRLFNGSGVTQRRKVSVLGKLYDDVIQFTASSTFLNFQRNLGIISMRNGYAVYELIPD